MIKRGVDVDLMFENKVVIKNIGIDVYICEVNKMIKLVFYFFY